MNKKNLDKKYFSISEVSSLCEIKPHTLRFWEKEFSHLKPATRKGSRRYYQKKDIDTINKIKLLLHEKGMTIAGAKNYFYLPENQINLEKKPHKIIEELQDILNEIK
jgi:DNA-binding transcriptional MerR regulator